MTWILSRSTSSWILVRACAGTPPEASGPVLTVMRPTRTAPLCPRTMAGKPSAEAPSPAAWMKRLRVSAMGSLLDRDSVSRVLGGVGLFRRLRTVESLDFHAFPENAHDRRHARRADVEKLR